MLRAFLLLVSTILLCALATGSASAASLSVTVKNPGAGESDAQPVHLSGTADAPSSVQTYQVRDGASCAATNFDIGTNPSYQGIGLRSRVSAGPFTVDLSTQQPEPGTDHLLICSYLTQDGCNPTCDKTVAVGSATEDVRNTGYRVATLLLPNLTGMIVNSGRGFDVFSAACRGPAGDCTGENAVTGTVSVRLREADRKKYKLTSAHVLKGPILPNGEGSFAARTAKFSSATRNKLEKAYFKDKARFALRATVTFVMTAPLQHTYTKEIVFRGRSREKVLFSCDSTNKRLPCDVYDKVGGPF